jgi:DNA polymerase III delta prime subunit
MMFDDVIGLHDDFAKELIHNETITDPSLFAHEMNMRDYTHENSPKRIRELDKTMNSLVFALTTSPSLMIMVSGHRHVGRTYAVESLSWNCYHGIRVPAFLAGRKIYEVDPEVVDGDDTKSAAWNRFLKGGYDAGIILHTDDFSVASDIVNSRTKTPVILEAELKSVLMNKLCEDKDMRFVTIKPVNRVSHQVGIIRRILGNDTGFMKRFGYIPSDSVLTRCVQIIALNADLDTFKPDDVIELVEEMVTAYIVQDDRGGKQMDTRFVNTFVSNTYGVQATDIRNIRIIPDHVEVDDVEHHGDGTTGSGTFTTDSLTSKLQSMVIGQDDAIARIAPCIIRHQVGLADTHKPIGSFLLAGPSGVGKTETAKALAKVLFGSEDNMIRIDCSELYAPHMVSRLLGAPQGYVGYGSGGQLSNFLLKHHDSVILFDEIEKAHPSIYDSVLLQMLDAGRVTSSQDGVIDCSGTLILLTSNIGSSHVDDDGMKSTGFSNASYDSQTILEKDISSAVNHNFRVELINRFDDVIVYHPLTGDALRRIFKLKWNTIEERLADHGIHVEIEEDVFTSISASMRVDKYGARNMLREINRRIVDPLADIIAVNPDRKNFRIVMDETSLRILDI